ncbi:MAG: hypothetical protein HY017_21110 [Betaproteobacteria bacterium]|nr:hypothetical protein [Betaproteobacteria bacterium]
MRAATHARTWLCALGVAWAAVTGAAPFVVPFGIDRLVLDVPPGFSDSLSMGSPRLSELAETVAGPSNRVLAFGLTDGDLRRFMVGDSTSLKRYVVAAMPREFERQRSTQAEFGGFVTEALRGLGEVPPAGSDPRGVLRAAREGRPVLLEFLRRDPAAVSYVQGTRLPGVPRDSDAPPVFVLVSTSLVLVRGKPMNFSIYTSFDDPSDVEWLQLTTRRWLEQIQRLNQ